VALERSWSFITGLLLGFGFSCASAQTLPNGGKVTAGQAQIGGSAQSVLVTQSSNKAIIDWNSFSIGKNGGVQFDNGNGATLNRVTGGNLSSIDGLLSATGSVYLLNPNGVIIGKTGLVKVGGSFVASTLNIADPDFLDGGGTTFVGESSAGVVNLGRIGALGGDVALIAANVRNDGSVDASRGTVGLVAGHGVLMRDAALDDGKFLVLSGGANTATTNTGSVAAAAVELRAEGGNVYALAGNTQGVIRATGVSSKDGRVYLTAGQGGSVRVAGSTIAATDAAGGGGTIEIAGRSVEVASSANLDASATASNGAGGSVTVIADKQSGVLDFHGRASARGGRRSGNGGFVETSGANVDFTAARVDTSAAHGATGTWLTDPYDLTVDSAAASTINTNLGTTNVSLKTTASGTTGPGNANAGGNGDISITAPINWSTGNTLTLDAYRNINVNANITASGAGKVVMVTGDTAGNGTSGSAVGDYSFGLTASGFQGSLSFTGGSSSGATLQIGTAGGGAPVAYTLIYALPSAAGGTALSGNQALATSLTDTVTRTNSVYTTFSTSTFTGLGHSVSGLNINSSASPTGFFGTVSTGASIRDINLSGATVKSSGLILGGLVGSASSSTVENDIASVAVTSTSTNNNLNGGTGGLVGLINAGTLTNDFTSGSVTGAGGNIGGLLGTIQPVGTVSNSSSSATMVQTGSANTYAGGLIGHANSNGTTNISNSYATGSVTSAGAEIGGLVGGLTGTGITVSNSYATGQVTGTNATNPNTAAAGGLVGLMSGGSTANPITVTGSYATGVVSAPGSSVGGLVGSTASVSTIINSYATGSATTAQNEVGGLVGGSSSTLNITGSYATGNVKATGATSSSVGGLVGLASTLVLNTSYASGSATGFSTVGGLVGYVSASGTLNDVYAQGAVTATSTAATQGAGGLIAVAVSTTITDAYASGAVSGPSGGTGGVIGRTSGTVTTTDVYWDSPTTGQSTSVTSSGTTTTGAETTSQLQSGTLPTGFNSGNTSNGTPWNATSGFYPYFTYQFPNGAQAITGHGYLTGGSTPAVSGTVDLYANGAFLGMGTTNGSGAYTALVNAGSITSSTAVGGTLTLSGGSSIVGATFTDTPTLSSGNLTGFDIVQGLFKISTSSTTDSALQAKLPTTFGSSVYSSTVAALSSQSPLVTEQIVASGAYTIDDAVSFAGNVKVQAAGTLTLGTSGSASSSASTGNVTLASTGGNVVINAPVSWSTANTLTYDADGNVQFNAPVTVSGAGKLVLVTGDTAGNGTGTSAGDYGFGLTANGFSGALNFTSEASAPTLTINNSPYTLIYTASELAAINNGTGKYALANSLDYSSAGTLTGAIIGALGSTTNSTAVLTGLGHTINNPTISNGAASASVAPIGINYGTVRDLGVVGGAINATGQGQNAAGFAGNNYGTLLNVYATDNVSDTSNAGSTTGGLVGRTDNTYGSASIRNAFATGTVTISGTGNVGGLVGFANTSTAISNVFAAGAVTKLGTSSGVGGLVGLCTGCAISNASASGVVTANAGETGVGGLVGSSSGTISNALATGAVLGGSSSSGGLVGSNSGTVTNGYYDSGTTGQSDTGKGTSQTAAQFQSGSLPPGLSSSTWSTGSGLYPYLTQFFPNGVQAISGIVSQSNGTAAAGASVTPYSGGSAIATLGSVASGANGYYYAVTPTGILPGSVASKMGATTTLNGASAVSGATFTDSPTLSNGNVTGLNLQSGLFLASTADTAESALNTDLSNTFGGSNLTSINSATLAGARQIDASGAFTLDTALTQTGAIGINAGGNLTLNTALTSSGALVLQSTGNITQGASGNVSGTSLALLGGNATLANAGNSVATLAGTGTSGLSYTNNGALTIGSIGPFNSAITLANINGNNTVVSGITSSGSASITAAGNLVVSNAIASSSGALPVTLTSTGSGAISSSTAGTINTNGGLLTINSAGSGSLAGTISGSGGLTKTGAGTTTILTGSSPLTGQALYTGATSVNQGGLTFNNNTTFVYAVGTSSFSVSNGATFHATGFRMDFTSPVFAYGTGGGTYQFDQSPNNGSGGGSVVLQGTGATFTTSDGSAGNILNGQINLNNKTVTFAPGAGTTLTANAQIWSPGTSSNVVQNGAGTTILTANQGASPYAAYAGTTTISAGTLQVGNGGSTGTLGTGAVINNANLVFNYNVDQTLSTAVPNTGGITGTGNTALTSTGAWTLDRPITQSGGTSTISVTAGTNLTINSSLAASSGTISLQAGGNVTQGGSGNLTASNLALLGGNVTLGNSGNEVSTLAASGVSGLYYVNSGALSIGTVGSTSGVSASGIIDVATLTGNMTAAQNVATTNAGTSAITLNAGQSAAAGTATGGNLVISGSSSITVGAGGRATLYSGSASADTSLAALIGSGSGRFRYDSDEVAANYTTPLGTGLYGIYRQQLGVSETVTNPTSTYGSTQALAVTSSGMLNGDIAAPALVNPQFSTSNNLKAGTYGVADSGLTGLGYSVTVTNATVTVNPLALTLSGFSAANKTYDGTTAATITSAGTLSGVLTNDVVTLSHGGAAFSDRNVGTGKTVTLGSTALSGADAGNYTVASSATTTADISAAPLIISTAAVSKTYDGTVSAPGAAAMATGGTQLFGSDSLSGGTFAYANKNAGTGNKVVTVSGVTVNDGDGGADYSVTYANNTTSTITPASLTIGGITAASKVYDGTTAATVSTGGATYTGLISGDSVTVSATGTFATKDAGTAKTVNLSSSYTGADAGNYSITNQATTTANITPASLTLSVGNVSKVYDGTTGVTGSVADVVGGTLFAGDTLSGGSFAYTNKDVGAGNKVVTVSGITVNDGAGGADYSVTLVDNTTSTITPAALTIGGITAANKVYDGTATATVSTGGATYTGLIGGDDVTVSASGLFNNKNVGNAKTVSLTSSYGGADVGNYTITDQATTTANISQAPLSLSVGNVTKTYDGTTTVIGGSVSVVGGTLFSGDTLSGGSFAYTSKNVGTGDKAVTVSGVTVSDGNGGGNYAVSYANNTTSTITPAALTLSVGNVTKAYDGSTSVIGGLADVVAGTLFSGDTLSGGSFAYANKNAGSGNKVVTVSGVTVNDADGGADYSVTYANNTASTITPATLTIGGIMAANKVYDGTTAAAVSASGATYTGLISGDSVTVSATGAFSDKNAGTAKTVNLTSTYGGADVGNYTITGQATTTANITPAPLTVTANNDARFVTQTDAVNFNGVNYTGLVGGDTPGVLNTSGLTVTRPNAGTDVAAGTYVGALVPGGVTSGNYAITYADGNYTIVPANNALVKVSNTSTIYGSTATYTPSSVQYMNNSNVISNLTLVGSSGNSFTYTDGAGGTLSFALNPANPTLSSSGLTAVGNYAISDPSPTIGGGNLAGQVYFTGNLSVMAKAVTAVASGVSKVYDATTSMTGVTLGLSGKESGDQLTVNGSGAFSQKNAGTNLGYTISDLVLSGADSGDYYLSGGASFTGNNGVITPAPLTLSVGNVSKVYDGNTSVIGGAASVVGGTLFGGDTLSGGSFAFANKNVGAGNKVVTVSGVTVSDDNGGDNYTVSYANNTTSTITPAALTIGGITAANKVYDATTVVTVSTGGATYSGLVGGDDVTVSATGVFDNKNAGTAKTVNLTSTYGGADVGNYLITDQATTTASITQAPLTLSVGNVTKTYDGTTNVIGGVASVVGGTLFGGDTLSGGSFAYTNKNAGTGNKVVSVSGATVNDGDGGNDYLVTYANNTTSTITPAALTIGGITAANKVYDGTTAATVSTSGATYTGLVIGDSVTVSATGAFSDKNAGTNKSVILTSNYTGADVGNYTIMDQASTTASIARALLTLSVGNVSKVYDGTTFVTGGLADVVAGTLFGGDTLSGGAFAYTNKNVGAGNKVVTVSGITVNDGNGGDNYAVSYADNTASTITQAPLTLSVGNVSKVYDGNAGVVGGVADVVGGTLFGGDTLSGGSFAYTNPNAGAGNKVVTVSGVTVGDGNGGGNYAVSYTNNTTSSITPAPLTVTANNDARFVTQPDAVNFNGVNYTGLVGGDTPSDLNTSGLTVNRPNAGTDVAAGTYAGALVPSGVASGNYAITYADGNYTIVPANNALVKVSNTSSTYGGTPTYTLSSVQYMNNSNVISNLTLVGNSGNNFTYTDGAGGTLSFALNATSPAMSSSGLIAVGNYAIGDPSPTIGGGNLAGQVYITGNLSVMAKAVTASASSVSKVYDGTTGMTGVTLGLTGKESGDELTVDGAGAFSQKNVGTSLAYNISNLVLSGADAGDYYLGAGASFTGSNGIITPASLTIGGITAANKVYDGTTAVTVSTSGATYTGLVAGDSVTVSASGVFNNKNAGAAKTVSLTSSYGGSDLANYIIAGQATTTANITPAPLTLVAVTASKVYDGTTAAAGVVDVLGLVGSDSVSGATEHFNSKNAGDRTLEVGTYTLNDGNGGGNYIVTERTAPGTIAPKPLTVDLTGTVTKTYNGSTAANLMPRNYSLSGLIAGDSVALNDPTLGNYANAKVGTGKTVSVVGLSLEGPDAGDYTVNALASGPIGTILAAVPGPTLPKTPPTNTLANGNGPGVGTLANNNGPANDDTLGSGNTSGNDNTLGNDANDSADSGASIHLAGSSSTRDGECWKFNPNSGAWVRDASSGSCSSDDRLPYPANQRISADIRFSARP
jgi:filamentous hemagglutinin family protein